MLLFFPPPQVMNPGESAVCVCVSPIFLVCRLGLGVVSNVSAERAAGDVFLLLPIPVSKATELR